MTRFPLHPAMRKKENIIAKFKRGVHSYQSYNWNGRPMESQMAHKKNTTEIHLNPSMSSIILKFGIKT